MGTQLLSVIQKHYLTTDGRFFESILHYIISSIWEGASAEWSGKTWAAAETFCQWKVKPTNQIGCGPTLVLCHCTSAGGPYTPRGKAITSVRRHPAIVKIPSTAAAPALISSAGSQCLQLVLWPSTVFIWSSFDFSAQRNKLNILAPT